MGTLLVWALIFVVCCAVLVLSCLKRTCPVMKETLWPSSLG